jgi:hypothetical protein
LEAQFALEKTIQRLGVLASVAIIDLLIGAHDGTHARPNGIGEWPEIKLVQSLVVNVGRERLGDVVAPTCRFSDLSEVF